MKLTIEIELGNDAMLTGRDAANAIKGKLPRILRAVSDLLNDGGKIMDENGNSVGRWDLEA